MSNVQTEPVSDLGGTKFCLRAELRSSLRQVGGKVFYLLEDPIHARFFHLGEREWALASLLDGKRTLREALQLAAATLGDESLSQQEALRLCRWLTNSQLATVQPGSGDPDGQWQPQPKRWAVVNPLFLKIPLFNPDRSLARILPWTRWMLTLPSLLVWLAVCGCGLASLWPQWDRFCASFTRILAPGNWLYLLLTWVFLKFVHELFHGLVCKKYGGTVPRCGIMLILFSPVAYVDVTSSWRFGSKWQRIFTAAAGMYVELFVAALAAIVWARGGHGPDAQLCHNIVTMAGVSTLLFNGNFLMRFDGYYILADLLGIRNLYALGQEYLRGVTRRYLLNVPAVEPAMAGPKMRFIKAYAVASFLWRITFYLGVILLAASLFHGAGIVLAILSAGLWFGLPAFRFVKYLVVGSAGEHPDRRRFGIVVALITAVLACGLSLPWPLGVSVPAVVEYAPLTRVRAESPGFVQEVWVHDGQAVTGGQRLLVLRNPKLAQQLADLELALQKSDVIGRILHQERRIGELQVERENRGTLVAKRDELQRQVASLTIRAASAGRVVGRNLDALVGQYVDMGRNLVTLGLEECKELQLSVDQADIEALRDECNRRVYVRIKGRGGLIEGARLVRMNPKATRTLLHPALAAPAGGPLAVTPRPTGPAAPTMPAERFDLAAPRFTAIVELPAEESRRLRAGELARVRTWRSEESIGRHLYRVVKRLIDKRMGRVTSCVRRVRSDQSQEEAVSL
jgi:putative peptide zinc metalloprotease protein